MAVTNVKLKEPEQTCESLTAQLEKLTEDEFNQVAAGKILRDCISRGECGSCNKKNCEQRVG